MLFSATLDGGIATLAKRLLKQPRLIECEATQANHDNIEQRLHYVDDGSHKHRLLDHLLRDVDLTQALVFTATKRGADRLAEALHGPLDCRFARQHEPVATQPRLPGCAAAACVLVAADVAARGIDVAASRA
jgi:superfamily II DNA/RNA helicase